MKVYYISLTGNVRRFIDKLSVEAVELTTSGLNEKVNDNYVVIVPSYNEEITDRVSEFVDHQNNIDYLCGFAGSGNRNFDNLFCFNAKDLSEKYNKPLLMCFEFDGTDSDVEEFKRKCNI